MSSRTIYLVPAQHRVQPRPIAPQRANTRAPTLTRNATSTTNPNLAPRQPQKRPIPSYEEDADPIEQLLCDDFGQPAPRKREKLNHLSAEEKMNRRKMKNRVAAQTARDRKKVRSQKLEDVVRDLLNENQLLREENERLRRDNGVFRQQAQEIQMMESQGSIMSNSTFESAAFISGPQQRAQVLSLMLIQAIIHLFLLKSCSRNSHISSSFPKMNSTKSSETSRKTLTLKSSPTKSKQLRMFAVAHRRSLLRLQWSRIS